MINYLKYLESESIFIIRELIANAKNPVMLYLLVKIVRSFTY